MCPSFAFTLVHSYHMLQQDQWFLSVGVFNAVADVASW